MRKSLCIIITVLVVTGMLDVYCHAEAFTNANTYCRTYFEVIKKEQTPDGVNWELLVKKANGEALSEWDKSESALEKDLKRNFDKWGNKDKEPFIIKNDSIFYRIYYSEQVFDMLNSLENLKGRLGEVLLYSKLYNSVKTLLVTMAQHNKQLYILMVSNERQRIQIIPYSEEEYKQFGSKAE